MRIRLLGPVELRREDGARVEVSGPKRRAVLALLSLELGRCVPLERLFELLWGDDPPAQARAALQGHVAALRKALDGSSFVLLTRTPGYELSGTPDDVDALRFDALAAEAATQDDAAASVLLERALGLWSGAALADLPDTELRTVLSDRLDDTRNAVMRACAGAVRTRRRPPGADDRAAGPLPAPGRAGLRRAGRLPPRAGQAGRGARRHSRSVAPGRARVGARRRPYARRTAGSPAGAVTCAGGHGPRLRAAPAAGRLRRT
jgi:hypothetical protein